jgi:hypothetical protein
VQPDAVRIKFSQRAQEEKCGKAVKKEGRSDMAVRSCKERSKHGDQNREYGESQDATRAS